MQKYAYKYYMQTYFVSSTFPTIKLNEKKTIPFLSWEIM